MDELCSSRPLISMSQTRVRRELKAIVRRDLPVADVQVTRRGKPAAMLLSPARLAELDEAERQLAELKGDTSVRS